MNKQKPAHAVPTGYQIMGAKKGDPSLALGIVRTGSGYAVFNFTVFMNDLAEEYDRKTINLSIPLSKFTIIFNTLVSKRYFVPGVSVSLDVPFKEWNDDTKRLEIDNRSFEIKIDDDGVVTVALILTNAPVIRFVIRQSQIQEHVKVNGAEMEISSIDYFIELFTLAITSANNSTEGLGSLHANILPSRKY